MTPAEETARSNIFAAILDFEAAARGEQPIEAAARALCYLSAAYGVQPDLTAAASDLAVRLSDVMSAAAPVICEAVAGAVSSEMIYFELGAASGLISAPPDLAADRADYAVTLAARLVIEGRRAAIRRRGDTLMRSFMLNRADSAHPPSDLHS